MLCLTNRSICALSVPILSIFSLTTLEVAEKRRSLSTLVHGVDRYLRATGPRAGKRARVSGDGGLTQVSMNLKEI